MQGTLQWHMQEREAAGFLCKTAHGKAGPAEMSNTHLLALDRFFVAVERRALRMAEIATRNREEALDIVQDAMYKLVRRYSEQPEAEWGPLFQRILQHRIQDWHRRNSLLNRWHSWLHWHDDEEGDPLAKLPDPSASTPDRQLQNAQAMQQLDQALTELPLRQQQAFLLRVWEGYDVAQTAKAMGCSQGSVKTHYSRAIHKLQEKLGDFRS